MSALLDALKEWGPLGALLVALIDGAGLPNPGGPDYLIVFLGWTRPESVWWSAALTVIGSLSGTTFLYWLARKGGEKYLDRKASGPRAMRFRRWFARYGLVTVFIPALVPFAPLPMKVFVLCAGALGVGLPAFLATVAAGRIPRYFALAYLGKTLGENSTAWLKQHKWDFILGAAVLMALLFLLVKVSGRFHKQPSDKMVAGHEAGNPESDA